MNDRSTTPEEAALGTRKYARVIAVAMSPDDQHAIVLVDKGRPGDRYLLQVACRRSGEGWQTFGDSNGYGWTALPSDERAGIMTCWGEAPSQARVVTIRWQGESTAAPVANGHYLFVQWNVPDRWSGDLPELATT